MRVSTAFKELSEVLGRLESSDTVIQHAGIDQDLSDSETSVTADLVVDVPILSEADDNVVSIELADATVQDGSVAVELSVAVSGESAGPAPTAEPRAADADERPSTSAAVPVYKDPEALEAVYERYDTFPEMTDALSVDVTSETVRRHMVKHDIHDPADDTPQSYADAVARGGESASGDVDGAEAPTVSTQSKESTSTAADADAEGTSSPEAESDGESAAQSAVTDGGSTTADTDAEDRPRMHRPVGEVVAEASPGQESGVSNAVVEFPKRLTVADLTEASNQSRTIHEVAEQVDLSQSTVRQLLQSSGLIHFVSSPLAADQLTASPDEVLRRLNGAQ
jgi:hypothetical protein